ncbi:hypothetical protein TorRG33x02_132310 [Trema orientale]|uniref:Uncharacterized protein n=1 Tax=Trema orientale TaxID=63057 RepID=A0A2P5EZQ9_TREOI|nr:hypothetical protein TorRG33x02_132310 [Trema orientale]
MGARCGYQEVSAMMAYTSQGSEWPRAIIRIDGRFGSDFDVSSSIEKHPEGETAYPQVLEFPSGPVACLRVLRRTLRFQSFPRVLRCTLGSHIWDLLKLPLTTAPKPEASSFVLIVVLLDAYLGFLSHLPVCLYFFGSSLSFEVLGPEDGKSSQ